MRGIGNIQYIDVFKRSMQLTEIEREVHADWMPCGSPEMVPICLIAFTTACHQGVVLEPEKTVVASIEAIKRSITASSSATAMKMQRKPTKFTMVCWYPSLVTWKNG